MSNGLGSLSGKEKTKTDGYFNDNNHTVTVEESTKNWLGICQLKTKGSMDKEQLTEVYNKWSQGGRYDKDSVNIKYRGAEVAADAVTFCFPSKRDQIRLLDVASGSGLLGDILYQRGFTDMDSLDPSVGMTELAKERDVYKNHFLTYMDENQLDIEAETYDVICSVASLVKGHLPAIAIYEMLRLLKPGGVVCIVANLTNFETIPEYRVKLRGILTDLERNGHIKRVADDEFDDYLVAPNEKHDGKRLIYRKI